MFSALRHLDHLAEHLAGAGLVEADRWVDEQDGVEQAGDAEGCDLSGQDRLAERRLHERLGGQVVHLGRPVVAERPYHRRLVEKIGGDQSEPVHEMGDALEVTVLLRRCNPITS